MPPEDKSKKYEENRMNDNITSNINKNANASDNTNVQESFVRENVSSGSDMNASISDGKPAGENGCSTKTPPDEATMKARKNFAESVKEFKEMSLIFSVVVFFIVWMLLSLFKGIDGIGHASYLFMVLTYLVIVHLNSMVFLPTGVLNMEPRQGKRIKHGFMTLASIGYSLLSATVFTLINMISFPEWGAFRTVLFGVACFALNVFTTYASALWVWFNYSIPAFAVSLAFTTICNFFIMHAIARSVIFMFVGLILCMGSYGKNSANSKYDFEEEMMRTCEDYLIIKGAEEWASGNWMM